MIARLLSGFASYDVCVCVCVCIITLGETKMEKKDSDFKLSREIRSDLSLLHGREAGIVLTSVWNSPAQLGPKQPDP